MEILVILILTSLLLIREYANYKERQKLLDRIMSKTYSEFKDMETPEKNDFGEEETELPDIESIEEEEREKLNAKAEE